MKIRKAKLNDFEGYYRLFNLFRKDDEEVFLGGFLLEMVSLKKNYKNELREIFRNYIYSTKKIIYFAEENNQFIGFISGLISTHERYYKYYNKEGAINGLFVIKEKRGKNVSSLLKNELFEWFKNKKLKYVSLQVMEKNKKAQKIYQKWGFKFFLRKMKLKL